MLIDAYHDYWNYKGKYQICFDEPAHEHTWNDGEQTKDPTCTEKGEKLFTCTVCGETKTEPIPALGHDFGDWEELNGEQHQRVCANDDSHVETENHKWDNGTVTTEASCVEEGEKTFYCTVCGATKEEPIPALGHADNDGDGKCDNCGIKLVCEHVWGEWKNADGKNHQRVRTKCGESEQEAHKWDGGKVTRPATCSKEGEKTFTCTVCGATKAESIAKTMHSPVVLPGKAPTCEEPGLSDGTVCEVCNEVLEAQKKLDPLGHVDNNDDGVCDNCGAKLREDQTNYKYILLGDVNMDGKVNSKDARLVLRSSARLLTFTDEETAIGDLSGDGKIKSADARMILRIAAKLEPMPVKKIAVAA